MLSLKDPRTLNEFKEALMRFTSLYNVSLYLKLFWIEKTEVKSLLTLISNLLNLSRISLNFESNFSLSFEDKSLLSPLVRLTNLSSVSLDL